VISASSSVWLIRVQIFIVGFSFFRRLTDKRELQRRIVHSWRRKITGKYQDFS
jgi:hypothetical protein